MRRIIWAAGVAASLLAAAPAAALSFIFTDIAGEGASVEQRAAFQSAADAWSRAFTDPIVVSIQIGFRPFGNNVLGSTTAQFVTTGAGATRTLLAADARSADDTRAVASLPAYGPDTRLLMTSAEARAIGFATAAGYDGTIEFTTDHAYSTQRDANGGIAAGTYDLIGIATHEIGHLLGFTSNIDIGSPNATLLDQYRYAAPGTRGATAGNGAYFSIDGGVTSLAAFSPGGAGNYQASHWLQGTVSGGGSALMDPAIAAGQVQNLTLLDLVAFDVLGYDPATVPEPASWASMVAGFGAIGAMLRRRRTRAAFA